MPWRTYWESVCRTISQGSLSAPGRDRRHQFHAVVGGVGSPRTSSRSCRRSAAVPPSRRGRDCPGRRRRCGCRRLSFRISSFAHYGGRPSHLFGRRSQRDATGLPAQLLQGRRRDQRAHSLARNQGHTRPQPVRRADPGLAVRDSPMRPQPLQADRFAGEARGAQCGLPPPRIMGAQSRTRPARAVGTPGVQRGQPEQPPRRQHTLAFVRAGARPGCRRRARAAAAPLPSDSLASGSGNWQRSVPAKRSALPPQQQPTTTGLPAVPRPAPEPGTRAAAEPSRSPGPWRRPRPQAALPGLAAEPGQGGGGLTAVGKAGIVAAFPESPGRPGPPI